MPLSRRRRKGTLLYAWAALLITMGAISGAKQVEVQRRVESRQGAVAAAADPTLWATQLNTILFTVVGGGLAVLGAVKEWQRKQAAADEAYRREQAAADEAAHRESLAAKIEEMQGQLAAAKAEADAKVAAAKAEADRQLAAAKADADAKIAEMKARYDSEIRHLWRNIADRSGLLDELKKHGIRPPSDFEIPVAPNAAP